MPQVSAVDGQSAPTRLILTVLSRQLQQPTKPSRVVGDPGPRDDPTLIIDSGPRHAELLTVNTAGLEQQFLLGQRSTMIEPRTRAAPSWAALMARHLTSRLQIQQLAEAAVYVKPATTSFIAAVTPPAAQPAPCRSNTQDSGSDTLTLP